MIEEEAVTDSEHSDRRELMIDDDSVLQSDNDNQRTPSVQERGSTFRKLKVTLDPDFMNVITKSTLLNFIGVLSNFAIIGYLLYVIVTDTFNLKMGASFRCLDSLINCICIFLAFGFSSRWYHFVCKCCHNRLRSCCKKLPKTLIR